ncbi:hypothetical protein CC53_gp049 [Rhizobium phage vB_RleS_L338C]|uniref:hypothetical protein n=1 Tax=Rhizobium phage vB_RleS_L338C TaxID=1414737 RepID=UPI0003D8D0E6|nr:hypothetical protein CC53_gp049 [Rhizobium phage vB_RleS_L338C]AHC30466.1 hypothetical protein L338C_049 [Rhizobium phage vB_RleS_L338C]
MGRKYKKGIDWNGVVFAIFMVALVAVLSSCVTTNAAVDPGKAPLPNFCEVQVAYRPPEAELQHVAKSPYTVDYLLKLNQFGQQVCGWEESVK